MPSASAHVNGIGTATPAHDMHDKFIDYVVETLSDPREQALFQRMAARSGIAHRRAIFAPDSDPDRLDTTGFYRRERFPCTSERMQRFAQEAPALAQAAVHDLSMRLGPSCLKGLTHLITVTCTGFTAPGLDLALMRRFELGPDIARTQVGFMGCNAALNGLKLADSIVRADERARVLVVNIELCSLHLQVPRGVDQALMFLLFADGAAATLVTADTVGLRLDRFAQEIIPDTEGDITWRIGDQGFDMHLSGAVPRQIARHVRGHVCNLLGQASPGQTSMDEIELWAIHPGGRSILDAAQAALELTDQKLATSRGVLHDHGNMSSSTVPFILRRMLDMGASQPGAGQPGEARRGGARRGVARRGVALGFGPGLSIESLAFAEAA
jgi:predicted naringenin-chalcone synthase